MRIAIIENHIISTNTVRRKLTETLIQKGYVITILSTGSAKELNFAKKLGFNVINVGMSNTHPKEVFIYIKKVYQALKTINADLCLTFTMRPAIWGNMVSRILKIPVITNITGIGPLAESNSIAYRVARTLYRTALKKTKVVFFQNNDDLKIFLDKKFMRLEQAQIIPGSGVDVDFFKPIKKQHHDGKFIFLFISRLIKDKGILEYVAAAEIVRQKYPDVVCQVIGPYYNQTLKDNIISEEQIMHWLDEGLVHYLGAAEDVRPFIAEADCIVLPSYREGMSNVLLEAASMERPTIASNVTGCKEIIVDNKTGLLCRAKDAKDLSEKMISMLNVDMISRENMGKEARKHVESKFAKQIVIDAYLQSINQIRLDKIHV